MKRQLLGLFICVGLLSACNKEKCAVYKVHNKSIDTIYIKHTTSKIDTLNAEQGASIIEECSKDLNSKPVPSQHFEKMEAKNKILTLSIVTDTNWKSLKIDKHHYEHVLIIEDKDLN